MQRLAFTATPPWRVDNMEGATSDWAMQAPLTRVPSANGISPLALENIIQLRLFLHDGQPWGWYYPVDHLDSPVLDLLNVRYLTASGDGAARVAKDDRFRLAASLPGQDVFENRNVLPRFFLVHEAVAVQRLAEARALIQKNVETFALGGTTKIWRRDARDLGPRNSAMKPFTLAFLDPPYRKDLITPALASLREGAWLAPNAIVIAEMAEDECVSPTDDYEKIDERAWGETKVVILSPAK